MSDGADDCDRLSKVHKCGQEKDPDLIGNMMQAADVSTPVVTKIIINFERIL
jgi:hypothetical protein